MTMNGDPSQSRAVWVVGWESHARWKRVTGTGARARHAVLAKEGGALDGTACG